jgi:hypothetical protein
MLQATIRQLPSVHALGELAPVAGLDPGNRLVAAIVVRLEHRGFAFADIEPFFFETAVIFRSGRGLRLRSPGICPYRLNSQNSTLRATLMRMQVTKGK